MNAEKNQSKNIYQRINAVMKDVDYVKKDVKVGGSGPEYRGVSHDQVVSVLRKSMTDHGIVVYPGQEQGKVIVDRNKKENINMLLYSGLYDINFVNIDDPKDRITVRINAHAADNGDKAPGKCVSYATKTAMLKIFCLETGENDESREEIKNAISKEQQDELAEMIKEDQRLWKKLCGAYAITHLDQLKTYKFDEIKTRIEEYFSRGSN